MFLVYHEKPVIASFFVLVVLAVASFDRAILPKPHVPLYMKKSPNVPKSTKNALKSGVKNECQISYKMTKNSTAPLHRIRPNMNNKTPAAKGVERKEKMRAEINYVVESVFRWVILLAVSCTIVNFVLVWHGEDIIMQFIMRVQPETVGIAIAVLMVIGAVFANIQRYSCSQSLGVPFRFTYANIRDNLDVFIELVGSVGLGLFLPVLIITLPIPLLYAVPVMLVSILFSWLIMLPRTIAFLEAKWRIFWKTHVRISAVIVLILCILAVLALTMIRFAIRVEQAAEQHLTSTGESLLSVSLYFIAVYVAVFIIMVVLWFVRRLGGTNTEELICEVDGVKYLVGMRYSKNQWVLLPCREDDYEEPGPRGWVVPAIYFQKGEFILRNLHEVTELKSCVCYRLEPEKSPTIKTPKPKTPNEKQGRKRKRRNKVEDEIGG